MRREALHIITTLLLAISAATPSLAQIKVLGNVYGGGDQAAVRGDTNVKVGE